MDNDTLDILIVLCMVGALVILGAYVGVYAAQDRAALLLLTR